MPPSAQALVGSSTSDPTLSTMVGQLESGGHVICGATLVAPGWALTANHCIEGRPRALRLFSQPDQLLVLGKTYPAPNDRDLALVEVPGSTHAAPFALAPAESAGCSNDRLIDIVSAAHRDGLPSRAPSQASLTVVEECYSGNFAPMLSAITPTRICAGDSGSPMFSRNPDGGIVLEGVVTSRVDTGHGDTRLARNCGVDDAAIGFAESLRHDQFDQWLARTATPSVPPGRFQVTAYTLPRLTWLALPAGPGAPATGMRVELVRRGSRVVGRGVVDDDAVIRLGRVKPGRYRLRVVGQPDQLRSRVFRVRKFNPARPVRIVMPEPEEIILLN